MTTSVLVVGAGPVGLTMAAELARYGVAVRVVDKAASRTDKSKALAVWSRTLELLDRAGCADTFVAAGMKLHGANIFAGGRRMARVDFAGIRSAYPFALMLPQSETERLLEDHLGALGVRVERQAEAVDVTETAHGVEAVLRDAAGHEERLGVDWLVGCDGAHSFVRHKLGLPFEGETMQTDWFLADIHMQGLPAPETELATYWHKDGVIAIFPITPGRFRMIADVGPATTEAPATPTLEQVQAVLDQRGPGGVVVSDPIWLSGFRINERKVADYRKGRVFVAGDAAHVHSPAGGQGMNTGMQDAINLAWKLALVCRGICPAEPLLGSYSAERSAVGDRILADAGRLTAAAMLRNPAAQAVRNLVAGFVLGLTSVNDAMAQRLSEITIGYPDSPLNGPHARGLGSPGPGERLAPVADEPPIGAGDRPRFALCAAPGEAASQIIAEFSTLLEPAPRPPIHEGGMWLVRPDGYVAAVARTADAPAIAGHLAAVRGSA